MGYSNESCIITFMLIDRVEVTFKGGNGGNGKVSFRKNMKGPDGGNAGDGGNLYVVGKSDLTLLNQFSRETEFAAENGQHGESNNRSGRKGENLVICLPVGTSLIEAGTGITIAELDTVDEEILLCRGGKGGLGNWEFRSSLDPAPRHAEHGKKGETKHLILSLKLIADYGLIGLPNAGKSSLLNELTNANAKTANYEFTTLEPNLGVFSHKVFADIPGLIEGASKGRGLGIGFLKHIEKVKVLLHCISCESVDPKKDYEVVRNELKEFNPELLTKEEIILLTKTDIVDKEKVSEMTKNLSEIAKNIIPVSVNDWGSLENLKDILKK